MERRGKTFALDFYVATPPQVCRKPGLTKKTYNTGCFCLGLSEEKIELRAVEDPFYLKPAAP